MKIPRGWTDYEPYGKKVEGTNLLPFKTPLKKELVQRTIPEEQWFTPALLKSKCPQLKAVIDLTDTKTPDRYYNPKDFIEADVEHLKIKIKGGGLVPGLDKIKSFSDAVDRFVKKFSDNPDALIGVHCTHGLNRTGYFICKYMVMKLSCQPKEAIDKFETARGYKMYRKNFIEEILSPGMHRGRPQRPDYRRPGDTVRPVHYQDPRSNWRFRGYGDAPLTNPSWESFHSSNTRRDRYFYGPSTSQGHFSNLRTYPYSQRSTDYRSPLEGRYEDEYTSDRYRSRYRLDRRK